MGIALGALLNAPTALLDAQDGFDEEVELELPEDGTTENFWVLDFKPIAVRTFTSRKGGSKGRIYWYLIYELRNPGDEDREIYIDLRAASERGKRYGDVFLPTVEREIEKKIGKNLWGRTDEFAVLADRDPNDPKYRYLPLKAGETRRSIAVFNEFDPNANHITIEIAGLSNEVASVKLEDGTDALGQRIRKLSYYRNGDEFAVTRDSFELKRQEWIRRVIRVESN